MTYRIAPTCHCGQPGKNEHATIILGDESRAVELHYCSEEHRLEWEGEWGSTGDAGRGDRIAALHIGRNQLRSLTSDELKALESRQFERQSW